MDPIDVNVKFENPEFPTRVRIIDLDGTFEHAGDYSAPEYTFSVKVEVKYNKVVDSKEKNLITCTFWTCEDSAELSFEDDDLSDEDVEDWFLEGLHDDLSFHNLEGLEDLDFYALGVPTNEGNECGKDVEDYISEAFEECISDIYEDYDYKCSDLYKQPVEPIPFDKELATVNGDCKTVWSIEDFEYEREYDDEDDINISFYVKCCFFIKDELLFSFEYKAEQYYFMEYCPDLYSAVVQKIKNKEMGELVCIEEDLSDDFGKIDKYVEVMEDEDYDSFEQYIEKYIEDNLEPEEGTIEVSLGEVAKQWQEEYDQMPDLVRRSFVVDFEYEAKQVIDSLFNIQQRIVKKVEEDPDDEYDEEVSDILDAWYNAIGIMYSEGTYYICFDSICGQEIDYESYGKSSTVPFTKEEIKDYVEGVYWQMLSY